ncbi:CHAP domain-containing protein [Agromyces sp. LHK192]|uniref:CHAP domain-containing protein n=1 Tax=Agromyces sp. LHK192 TaxID=2498704 RepID=UPI001F0BBC6D|nr:CHAP domain-containing protein [Agromyces sp. LHK192]
MSGDVTSGMQQPTSRAARRAAEAAAEASATRSGRRRGSTDQVASGASQPTASATARPVPPAGRPARTPIPAARQRPVAPPAPAPRATGAVRRTGPTRVLAAVLVVPAIIGTVALPAYAMAPGAPGFDTSHQFSRTTAEAQDVDVSALAGGASLSSDAYAVKTKVEIDEEAAEAERSSAASLVNRAGAYYTPAQQAEGDDYPWWNETPDDYGGGLSPLRYYYRECVDFVAWRMNRDAGVTSGPWKWDWSNLASGSAYAWADEWAARGRATSSEPIVGSVAWFPYNHVAYVQAVNGDGTVTIEEYNQNSDHSYHVRTIPASSAIYLYPPV